MFSQLTWKIMFKAELSVIGIWFWVVVARIALGG